MDRVMGATRSGPVQATPRRRLRQAGALAATVALALGVLVAVFGADTRAVAVRQASILAKPAIPTSSAYLGGFVAPGVNQAAAQGDIRYELSSLNIFHGALGRPLGIVHVYQGWSSPTWVQNSVLSSIAATGATPIVDWTCGWQGGIGSDANIIAGNQDGVIKQYADQLKGYGRPIFLRWFWEMNLVSLPRNRPCLGSGTVAQQAANYVLAWQHLQRIFVAEGASNVAFVWCPSANNLTDPTLGQGFYPGSQYVDWVGWDFYDRTGNATTTLTYFQAFYNHWVGQGLPMLVGETGALSGATTDQANYVAALATALPLTMPKVKALIYYDSVTATSNWTLTDFPGNAGFTQFVTLAGLPYFGYPYTGS